jgi:hypothetical protein
MSTPARRVIPGSLEVPGAGIQRGLRACDADRSRYISYLARCHEAGYIDGDVFTARMEAAAECVTRDELEALTSDLLPLAPPRQRARDAVRGLGRTPLRRRWLHIAGAAAALCWSFILPVLIFTATGFPVTYRDGRDTWVQIEHPGAALALLWFCIVTGVLALAVDLVWWAYWEMAAGRE